MENLLSNYQSRIIMENSKLVFPEELSAIPHYLDYFKRTNGGYFYDNALHFFGQSDRFAFHDFKKMNMITKEHFQHLIEGLVVGEDVFGNLFLYRSNAWGLFNVESAAVEQIANGLDDFLTILTNDIEYYSGGELLDSLSALEVDMLGNGYRLAPKVPFILGGDFTPDNLCLKMFDENLGFSATIAHQIFNLQDGQRIKIKLI